MRILAIDYGENKCGIAISDPLGIIAQPYKIVKTERLIEEIQEIIRTNEVKEIVIGLPFRTDGKENPKLQEILLIAKEMEKVFNIPVNCIDERYTSKEAEEILKKITGNWRKRKEKIDAVSAAIILKSYIDKRR